MKEAYYGPFFPTLAEVTGAIANARRAGRIAVRSLVGVALVAGCLSPASAPPATNIPDVEVVYGGSGLLYGVAWADDARVIVSERDPDRARFVAIHVATGEHVRVESGGGPPDCDGIDELSPVTEDGVLYWLRVCLRGADLRRYELLHETPNGIAIDGTFETAFPVGGFSVDGAERWSDYGSRICNTLFRLGEAGIEPVHITVEGPEGSFDTGGDVRADCDRMAPVSKPALRNGQVAFVAATPALGRRDSERLGLPADVYVADVSGGTARRIPVSVVDVGDVAWLDDRTLLVSGERPVGTLGTWRIDVATGAIESVLPFAIRSLSFSPNGLEAAAMRTVALNAVADELVVFPANLLR